ncbi:MFS family permease [Amorphus suaedae]
MHRSLAALLGLAAVLVGLAVFYRGAQEPATTDYAFGCDPFGYSRQAQLFRDEGLVDGLDTRMPDREAPFLIDLAPRVGIDAVRYSEMLAPHCHHYEPKTDAVILQYPPGTGFLLSLLPADRQVDMLYVASLALLVLCFGLYAVAALPSWGLAAGMVGSLAVAGATISNSALMVSYSAPTTLGLTALAALLVMAGLPAGRTPRWWAGALLGLLSALMISVRIPNAFILAGLAAFIVLETEPWKRARLAGAVLYMASGLVAFAVGLVPLLAANRINAGGILNTTYGAADSAGAHLGLTLISSNLFYYFVETPAWPITVAAVAALAMGIFKARMGRESIAGRRLRAGVVGGGLPFLISVAFFATHEVRASYYLVPSAFFCLAMCLFGVVEAYGGRPFNRAGVVSVTVVVAVLAALQVSQLPRRPYSFNAPAEVLDKNAIVWADRAGSTLYYYLGKYSGKIPFGWDCEQNAIINGVSQAGRTQYFIVDSEAMNRLTTRLQHEDLLEWAGILVALKPYAIYRMKPGGKLNAC